MAECGDGDSSNGRAVQGLHDTLWTWQQHEEAVQGPMTDYGPGSSMRSRYGGPWQITGLAAAMRRRYRGPWQSLPPAARVGRRLSESNGRVAEQKQLQLKGLTQA
ncbi:unnamed protein product [Staurois parvus]|uniref:Uncharacterized protein n=1 Tax=Staurois parvus TaxID=386267 RepID=A0ABN9H0Y5_9NEOB|nr:unnamed protein product [Staurois parvus]